MAGCTCTGVVGGGQGVFFWDAGLCLVCLQGWCDWSKQPVPGCNGCCLLCSSRLLGSANKLYSTAAFSSCSFTAGGLTGPLHHTLASL